MGLLRSKLTLLHHERWKQCAVKLQTGEVTLSATEVKDESDHRTDEHKPLTAIIRVKVFPAAAINDSTAVGTATAG